jgi:hypothetical protein
MFLKTTMMLPVVTLFAVTAAAFGGATAASAETVTSAQPAQQPDREKLQTLLITSQDLQAVTQVPWTAGKIVVTGVTGPAGTTEPSGCTALDKAVLAQNTGLIDSGVQPFRTSAGDIVEQVVVWDPSARDHVQELRTAIIDCPQMKFSDGPAVTLAAVDLGEHVAGFRAITGGDSQSAVLVAAHGNYVIELVVSDNDYPDSVLRTLLSTAMSKIDITR